MAGWISSNKRLEIAAQTGHPCATPGVGGSALAVTHLDFGPIDFYLAAAFCSHMHPVAPSAASPEANMMRATVAHHVDDAKADFAIEATADGFKDYVKAYFSGTVATALAFIAMEQNGYSWAGHFEHLRPLTAKGRSPDFVFASPAAGTCLVESKGTRSANTTTFDGVVEDGYLEQVERHLGTTLLNGAVASHGYCVGSWMTSVSKAELLVHHSEASPPGPGGAPPGGARRPDGDVDGRSVEAVQQQDMGTAFTLAFGEDFGAAVRNGRIDELPELVRIHWMDREWIAATDRLDGLRVVFTGEADDSSIRVVRILLRDHVLAIERKALNAALGRFWAGGDNAAAGQRFVSFDTDMMRLARESGGALLGDGLAAVPSAGFLRVARVKWNWRVGDFDRV